MVRGMLGVGGVCEICMCLAQCGLGGKSQTQSYWNGEVLDVCLCLGCGGISRGL